MNVQLAVVLKAAGVSEAARMVEQDAQRELGSARIAFEVGIRGEVGEGFPEVLLDRLVEIERASLDKTHDNGREGRLRERGGRHHGVRREREILFDVAQTVGLEVDDLAVMEERDASARDMRGLDQAAHSRIG